MKSVLSAVVVLVLMTCITTTTAEGLFQLSNVQKRRAVRNIIEHHSFSPPLLQYYYGDGEMPHWKLSGSTVITDEYVRLTPEVGSRVGHLWNTEPLDMDAFEIVIGFRVHRKTGYGADGFALWITNGTQTEKGPISCVIDG